MPEYYEIIPDAKVRLLPAAEGYVAPEVVVAGASTFYATAVNTAVEILLEDEGWAIERIEWSLSDDPEIAVALTVAVDGTTVWSVDVISGGPGFLNIFRSFPEGVVTISLGAAGVGIAGKLNVAARSEA